VVDGGGLENHCTGNGAGGSNPSPSARLRSPFRRASSRQASEPPTIGEGCLAEAALAAEADFHPLPSRSCAKDSDVTTRVRTSTPRATVPGAVVSLEFASEQVAIRFDQYLKSGSGRAFAKRHFS
jgi:hypothetical protein